jgi:hypothetical protein
MTATGTTPYVRGTITTRERTAYLATNPGAGHLVLTSAVPNAKGEVRQPSGKVAAVVRTTVSAEFGHDTTGRRSTRYYRYYVLHFADGTRTVPTVAHEAWTTVPQGFQSDYK